MKKKIFTFYKRIVKILAGHRLERIYPFKILNSFIISYFKPDFIEIYGHKMFLDKKDCLRLSVHGVYEELETKTINENIKEGDTVLDIGANIGYYTLIFARLVGKSGKVFAFEPDPENFSILERNIKINNYKNVTLVKSAVSNFSGKTKLFLSDDAKLHSLYKNNENGKAIEIKTIKLDDFFKDYKNGINFIKIDIEGSEMPAFEGMSQIIRKNNNIKIATEFKPILLKKFGTNPRNVIDFLLVNNFKLYNIDYEANKVRLINQDQLLKNYREDDGGFTNLLCIKK